NKREVHTIAYLMANDCCTLHLTMYATDVLYSFCLVILLYCFPFHVCLASCAFFFFLVLVGVEDGIGVLEEADGLGGVYKGKNLYEIEGHFKAEAGEYKG
ncbi:hypothetical protein, partial [Clostridioides difficile]|uniref:hypothetical protein n=1 Tax=Clostridioides difficile TaxID=1496 RepID=UPI001A9A8744